MSNNCIFKGLDDDTETDNKHINARIDVRDVEKLKQFSTNKSQFYDEIASITKYNRSQSNQQEHNDHIDSIADAIRVYCISKGVPEILDIHDDKLLKILELGCKEYNRLKGENRLDD